MLYPRRLISLVLVHKFESQNDLGKTQHGCCKYITVGKIIEEETLNTFTSAQGSSKLAVSQEWTDKLPSKLLTQSFEIIHGVAEASLQMTNAWRPGEGRCCCGSCKKLKFSWKISPTHPSFFGGCVKYTRQVPQRHDRAQQSK